MKRTVTSLKTLVILLFVFAFAAPVHAQETELEHARKIERQVQRDKAEAARRATTARISSEEANYLVETSRVVDILRYEDVRGTPYRYKKFRPATLYDPTLNAYELDSVNFNGFTSQFEYREGGQTRELNPQNFLRVEVPLEGDEKHVYARGINPRFRDKYADIVYKGEDIVATLIYDVQNEEKVVQDVGKTLRLRRFTAKSLHYAVVDGDYLAIKMTAKNLASDLGFKSELLKFIKANKLKVGKRQDLVRIYKEADRLYGQ